MQDPISLNPNQQVGNKKDRTAIIVVIFVLVILIGSFLVFRQSEKTTQKKATVVQKIEPSPTEKPKIDKSSIKIQVLNGTGTPGQAGTAVDALTKAGYSADNIKAANAKTYDNTVTTITAKDGFADVATDIRDTLKSTFNDVVIDSTHLDKTSEFDIVVVTGGKIFQEATPTTSATSTPSDTSTPSPTTTSPTDTPTFTPTPISTPTPTP